MGSSSGGKRVRAMGQRLVKMYLALAASFPPARRMPNIPPGYSRFTLLEPTNDCAIHTMVDVSAASPWW